MIHEKYNFKDKQSHFSCNNVTVAAIFVITDNYVILLYKIIYTYIYYVAFLSVDLIFLRSGDGKVVSWGVVSYSSSYSLDTW